MKPTAYDILEREVFHMARTWTNGLYGSLQLLKMDGCEEAAKILIEAVLSQAVNIIRLY